MIERFRLHIDKKFNGFQNQKLLLALSGGLDSMVLLNLLAENKIDFSVAHCNFNLRGDESEADALFVSTFCTKKQIPFFIKKFDTNAYSKQHKVSTQMAARELRYNWFNSLCKEYNFSKVVTAHHLNDELETFMINLGRGTGLLGLTGIPENTDTISRPLLVFTKAELLEYAQKHSLEWREDKSNTSNTYLRNALRNKVIPDWINTEPHLIENFKTTLSNLKHSQQVLTKITNQWKEDHFLFEDKNITVLVDSIKKLTPLNYYLHELFSPFGFQLNDLKKMLNAQSGKQLYSKTHRLLMNREKWIICPNIKPSTDEIKWDGKKDIEYPLNICLASNYSHKSSFAALNNELLKYPLTLRKHKQGDYFYPVGMKGKKKLSKYFKDEKYSQIEKENQWLLCSEQSIVWVIGKRVDQRFSINPKNKNCLILKVN